MNTQQAVQKISDAISDLLHGKSREQVVQVLSKDPTPQAVAAMLYRPARQALHEAEAKGFNVDEQFIFAVVTDAIDLVIEMLEAMGKMENEDEFRKTTLMEVLMLHAEQTGDDPEQRAVAQENLKRMADSGELDKARQIVSKDAKKVGLNEDDFKQGAVDMLTPRQRPVTSGVQGGLQ